MEQIQATLRASLDVDCPHCGEMFDAFEQDDGGDILLPIFNNAWDDLKGIELECPHCRKIMAVAEVEW